MTQRYFIQDFALMNALGNNNEEVFQNWKNSSSPGMRKTTAFRAGEPCMIGHIDAELPEIPEQFSRFACKNNQLLLAGFNQIKPAFEKLMSEYGSSRIGIVLGTSTSGIANSEQALAEYMQTDIKPASYDFKQQEINGGCEFLKNYTGTKGPNFTVSTACSSSANAFASAMRLIDLGICDAVIVGGADSLCQMTVQGFSSLESVSNEQCQPFSKNRKGINIGEAVGLFLVTKDPFDAKLELFGVGCSSDAHHISAPEPSGEGAIRAIEAAIKHSPFKPVDVDYINLHGTATRLNDAMESRAVNHVFGTEIPCSSTKSLTGHTLGAAAATEVGLCCLLLSDINPENAIPPQQWDGERDEELPRINIAEGMQHVEKLTLCLSNSFAFGGNNTAVLIGHIHEA